MQRTSGTGAVLSSRINDAFGTAGGSAATGDPYDGFGGQYGYYTDTETGLQLCTFRYYDPATGRWINRDPIGYAGGINVYAYCVDNPITLVDPSGLIFSVEEQSSGWGCSEYKKSSSKNEKRVKDALEKLKRDPSFRHIINRLEKDKKTTRIRINRYESQQLGNDVYWRDAPSKIVDNYGNETESVISSELALGHELVHAYRERYYPKAVEKALAEKSNSYNNGEEKFVIDNYERPYAQHFGDGVRYNHKGHY